MRLNLRLIDQHDRNVVLDGIHAVAFLALQPGLVRFKMYGRFALRADKYFQQFLADRHRFFSLSQFSSHSNKPSLTAQWQRGVPRRADRRWLCRALTPQSALEIPLTPSPLSPTMIRKLPHS